jgi:hypothetical protein
MLELKAMCDRWRNGKETGAFKGMLLAVKVSANSTAVHVNQLEHARVAVNSDVPVEKARTGLDILDMEKLGIFERGCLAVE